MTEAPTQDAVLTYNGVTITITRSGGSDGAVLVMVDTEFSPDGSDGGPGLRILCNDCDCNDPGARYVEHQPKPDCELCGAEIDDEPVILTTPMPARIVCDECARKEAATR